MNNLKTNLNKLLKYIIAEGIFLAYQGLYEIIKNRPISTQK